MPLQLVDFVNLTGYQHESLDSQTVNTTLVFCICQMSLEIKLLKVNPPFDANKIFLTIFFSKNFLNLKKNVPSMLSRSFWESWPFVWIFFLFFLSPWIFNLLLLTTLDFQPHSTAHLGFPTSFHNICTLVSDWSFLKLKMVSTTRQNFYDDYYCLHSFEWSLCP